LSVPRPSFKLYLMRLYAQILLFFLGAISFQALLTSTLIMGLISRNNQTAARAELQEESALVYENYNSWVRVMWKSAIRLRDDAQIAILAENSENFVKQDLLIGRIRGMLMNSGIDSFVVRGNEWDHFEFISDAYPFINDFTPFISKCDHPYISLKVLEETVFLMAAFCPAAGVQVFLLKHIDEDFYNHLKTKDHTRVFISSDSVKIWNTVGNGEDRSEILRLKEVYPPYREIYNIDFGSGHYNVSMQNLGRLEGNGDLKLLVFMSIEHYLSILGRIGKIVLGVSLCTVILIAVAVLIFTGKFTHPIHSLVEATRHIQSGDFSVLISEKAHGEVQGLIEGFNEMVRHLRENKITLDANLKEITFLKDYNETIIHSFQAGILVVNEDLIIEKANSYFRKRFPDDGDDLAGIELKDISLEIINNEVLEVAREIVNGRKDPWVKNRRESDSVWEIKLYPLIGLSDRNKGHCVIEIDDISSKVELEQKILQTEKLSALNFLSAGMAHEINNPLSTILSNVQMLLEKKSDGPDREALEWIEKETQRIAGIIHQLRGLTVPNNDEGADYDINECIDEVLKVIQYGIPAESDIRIMKDLAPSPLGIAIPKEGLQQIVMNIIQNAVQAIGSSGQISIKTSEHGDGFLHLIISDSGEGIPEEIRNHIFDPFFTTKTDGRGTGLGLSIVYGIVKKSGGDIEVKSQTGKGTAFTLKLPESRG